MDNQINLDDVKLYDVYNLFKSQYVTPDPPPSDHILTLKDKFSSDDNINTLCDMYVRNNRYNIDLNIIKSSIKKYIDSWILLGKFDNVEDIWCRGDDAILIDYNQKFMDAFQTNISTDIKVTGLPNNESNPFRDTFNGLDGKLFKDYDFNDIKNMYVQSDTSNLMNFSIRGPNKRGLGIKYYEKSLYHRPYDRDEDGSILYSAKEDETLFYKTYDMSEVQF